MKKVVSPPRRQALQAAKLKQQRERSSQQQSAPGARRPARPPQPCMPRPHAKQRAAPPATLPVLYSITRTVL